MDKIIPFFIKALMVIALGPAAITAVTSNPPIGIIVSLVVLSMLVPGFRPFNWLINSIKSLVSGIFDMIKTIFTGIANILTAITGGTFTVLGAMIGGFFSFLTFGWSPFGQRGAKFLGGLDHWKLLGRRHKGLVVDGYRYRLTEKASFESILTVGGMGRGKSSTFVVPNLLTMDGCSFVVSDTSGELFQKTSGHLAAKGYRIRVLNLMDPARSETYNPLANARSFTEIGQVAEIIMRSALPGNQKDAFWNIGAEKIIRIMIQCLRNNGDPAYLNLANVKHLLASFDAHTACPGQLGKIDQFVMNATQNDPSTWTDYRGFVGGNAKTMLSFLSTADAALSAIGNPQIANLTATSSIDFGELRRHKTALYVMVRQQDMIYYQFLLNLFYTDLFGSLLGQFQADHRPVYLLLDEFGHLSIPNFNVFATTARKYRVGFWIFLQSLSQLEARYGAHDAETIRDGLQTEIYLPGVNLDTARRLEARLGRMANPTSNGSGQPLLTADEIIRLKDNRALMFHSNKRPALLKTRPYFKRSVLRHAAARSPANLPTRPITTLPLIQI